MHTNNFELKQAASLLERVCGSEASERCLLIEEYIEVLNLLGDVYAAQRKPVQSRELYEKALVIASEQIGSESLQAALCLTNIGKHHLRAVAFAAAKRTFAQAVAILEKGESQTWRQRTGAVMILLGQTSRGMQDYEAAERWGRNSIEILSACDDSYGLATGLLDLAETYSRQGEYDEGEPLHRQALELFEKVGHSALFMKATCLHKLAVSYQRRERQAEAESCYGSALNCFEQTAPGSFGHVACLVSYADHLRRDGRSESADKVFALAEDMKRRLI